MRIDLAKEKETFYLRIFILITLVVSFFLWLAANNVLFIIIPVIQLLPLLLSPYFLFQNIGTFELGEDEIIINQRNVESVKIRINDKIRMKMFYDERSNEYYKRFVAKGFLIRLQIEAEDGFFCEYKMLIKKEQREEFLNILKMFYEKGVNIKERDSLGAKYFLLEGNLSFKKIQEIKTKYSIIW